MGFGPGHEARRRVLYAAHIGPFYGLNLLPPDFAHVAFAQIRTGQIRVCEVGRGQIGAGQVSVGQVGVFQIRIFQVAPPEVGPTSVAKLKSVEWKWQPRRSADEKLPRASGAPSSRSPMRNAPWAS